MKIVLTGSLGHISQPLAEELLAQGHAVTVISSSAERQAAIGKMGATAAIGSVEDADFLAAIFAGADAVYAMIPPNMAAPDIFAYYRSVGSSYTAAIKRAGVQRVVHLSSWGADLNHGTGFIVGSHEVEGLLNELSDVDLTHLRPGSFYYNYYGFAGMIKHLGFIASNYGDDDVVVLSAPADIAAAAAQELTAPTGPAVRYLASDVCTCTEMAQALGTAIGRPNLPWRTISDAQAKQGLEQSGIPPRVAALFVELGAAIHHGTMRQGYLQNPPATLGQVKLADFAQEFAAAF